MNVRHLHRTMRSFTLTELMVAIAIIAVIGGITAIGIRTVAREARLSSGTNEVVAALDNGRALAIRENTLVAVVFRARLDRDNDQYTEVVTAKWTGQTPVVVAAPDSARGIDVFEPFPGIATRRLPSNVQVAAPLYHSSGNTNYDDRWTAQSNLTSGTEEPMRVVGVMYAPDGTVVTRNSTSDAWRAFVDFNGDNLQQVAGCTTCGGVLDYSNPPNVITNNFSGTPCSGSPPEFNVGMMQHIDPNDEPFITVAPFLAVFDNEDMRSNYDTSEWDDWCQQQDDMSAYILDNADHLHFNRYTGVVLQ